MGAEFPTPRSFPNLLAGLLIVLGIALFVAGLKRKNSTDQKVYSITKTEAKPALVTLLLMVLYVISLYFVPYIPATIVVLALMIFIYGQRSLIKLAGASVAVPVIIIWLLPIFLNSICHERKVHRLEVLSALASGFGEILQLSNQIYLVLGVVMGAIPGLTATMAITLIIPLTYYLTPTQSLIMLLATYNAGNFGGSISAILISTPGAPAAAATVADGYGLARKGQGGLQCLCRSDTLQCSSSSGGAGNL